MRLPNGFGSIYKLSGNRRRPYVARKTVGWDDNGRQLFYIVGYFEKRGYALQALTEYNKHPIGERRDVTLGELYKEWSTSKFEKLASKTQESYITAWKHLSTLEEMAVKDIRTSHIQNIIDSMSRQGLSRSSCHKVKVLASLLMKQAMADDITMKNYTEFVSLPENEKKGKQVFTDLEIHKIEEAAKRDEWANTILILIYTGMRISELLGLTKFNIDIDNMLITGGVKTDAGKNRIIPAHPKIQQYIQYWHSIPGSYFIQRNGDKVRANYYRKYLYYPTLEQLGVHKLTPHATRHTFASLLGRAGANTKAIQEIIGHADYSTTANIYTHLDIGELRKAIESI